MPARIKLYTQQDDSYEYSVMALVLQMERVGATEFEFDRITNLQVGETYYFKGKDKLKPITRIK